MTKSLLRKGWSGLFLVAGTMAVIGCQETPPKLGDQERNQTKAYPQDFKTDIAWITVEWSRGRLYGYGSGFLIDREKGAFYTNKHVSDLFDELGGRPIAKIFFNGRAYDAQVLKVAPLRDAAIVCLEGSFDFSLFPVPAPIASGEVKVKDKVWIEGFHVHPFWIREKHQSALGYQEKLVPILRSYYGLGTRFLAKEREIVFEKIEGIVQVVGAKANLSPPAGEPAMVTKVRNQSNTYFKIKTNQDHHFSFGGLSGTAVRNDRGEIVGIVTVEEQRFEVDPETMVQSPDGQIYVKPVFDILLVTPIETVANLKKFLP